MKGHALIARDAWSLASRTSIGFGVIATASNRQSLSRTHVATIILSSLIAFGLAPSIAAAQSPLPQCPSDRNQVWTDCAGAYGYSDGSRYVGEFRDNKRSGQGTLTFANGDKYVGEWSDGNENGQGTYTLIGSRVSLGQNFGEPISFKQEAFQYNPERDGDQPAFTACVTASMSSDR